MYVWNFCKKIDSTSNLNLTLICPPHFLFDIHILKPFFKFKSLIVYRIPYGAINFVYFFQNIRYGKVDLFELTYVYILKILSKLLLEI